MSRVGVPRDLLNCGGFFVLNHSIHLLLDIKSAYKQFLEMYSFENLIAKL